MDRDEITLYCICRAPDIDRFMIMCDQCEEWYHGDCINITERESRRIKYFYCKWCRRKDSSLKVQYRKSKKNHGREGKKEKSSKKKITSYKEEAIKIEQQAKKRMLDNSSHNSDQTKHVDNDNNTLVEKHDNHTSKGADSIQGPEEYDIPVNYTTSLPTFTKQRQRCGKCENCIKRYSNMECHECLDLPEGFGCVEHRCINETKGRQHSDADAGSIAQGNSFRKGRNNDLLKTNRVISNLSQNAIQPGINKELHKGQCYGPNCTQAARSKSKYCSEDCGKRLAAKRLLHIMPARVSQWNSTPTIANEVGSQELERIRSAMLQARTELQALEDKFQHLESIIARSKNFSICEGSSDTEDTDESDHCVFCVVCGHSVSLRSAIKHMDRCYIKIESQISFGSVYPTRIEGSERLFCDVYNSQQQTYCKRLQVICPEHSKEPKISANEVCGCPLTNDIFQLNEPTSARDFCGRAKRKCNKHYKWESMYRASVDLQRIRQWLKIDEIFEEERRIRNSMVSRAGVIPLLLHQTTAHDPLCLDMRTKPSNVKRPAYRLVI